MRVFWIDLEWEDLNLAPLRWEAAEPQADDIRDLSERIFGGCRDVRH